MKLRQASFYDFGLFLVIAALLVVFFWLVLTPAWSPPEPSCTWVPTQVRYQNITQEIEILMCGEDLTVSP